MTIKEAREEIKRLQDEYEEARRVIEANYTSANAEPELRKLRKKYGVRDKYRDGVSRNMTIDDVVSVKDVAETEIMIDGLFVRRTKKAWKVSTPDLEFTAGYFSGARKLKKGQQIRISGKFCFGIKYEYDSDGDGKYMSIEECSQLKTNFC